MINWFKHKDYPDYWNSYKQEFKKKSEKKIKKVRFVVFDTETTGLDLKKDKILSIGAISVKGNTIDVSDSFEVYLNQEKFNRDSVEIHGIIKKGNYKKIDEEEALKQFLAYIKNSILVAHHAAFDVAMINQMLKKYNLPKLKNKVLDTGNLFKKTSICETIDKHYSLDELCDIFKIKKHDRHTASGDAFITSLIMIKIISLLQKNRKLAMSNLFSNPNKKGLI